MRKLSVLVHTLFFLLIGITFSPFVIPQSEMGKTIYGMPQTLWAGVIISCLIFVLTVVQAIMVDPQKKQRELKRSNC